MVRLIIRDLTVAAFLFCAAGCLITSHKATHESGIEVGRGTLRQIEPGKTTEQWLLAALGEPTSRAIVRGPDDVHILGYSHEKMKKSRGSLFLLFSGSSKKIDKRTTYFEITNGVVTRYWVEH